MVVCGKIMRCYPIYTCLSVTIQISPPHTLIIVAHFYSRCIFVTYCSFDINNKRSNINDYQLLIKYNNSKY